MSKNCKLKASVCGNSCISPKKVCRKKVNSGKSTEALNSISIEIDTLRTKSGKRTKFDVAALSKASKELKSLEGNKATKVSKTKAVNSTRDLDTITELRLNSAKGSKLGSGAKALSASREENARRKAETKENLKS